MRKLDGLYVSQLLLLGCFGLTGCIKQYYPAADELKPGTLVVMSQLTNKPGIQHIRISRSSTIVYPEFDPVTDCYVFLESMKGGSREFTEADDGRYTCDLDQKFLKSGRAYRITILTPGGRHYESSYEELYPAPAVEDLYYTREDQPTSDPEVTREGVQFYMDFEIEKDSGRYLRWQLVETYEIHNPEHQAYIYDVDRVTREVPDSSTWRTCWLTHELPEIYTMDLGNVEGNSYQGFPLNFVSTETRRLHYRYSLLVRQMAMSKAAYFYWDELGKNIQSQGNLFDKQAALTPGNICNLENDEELVIGYFSISGVSEARVFVAEVPGLEIYKDPYYCAPGAPPVFLNFMPDQYLPVYMAVGYIKGERWSGEVHKYCVDCRAYKGSTHIKPDFW